jgi:hypothetical protein
MGDVDESPVIWAWNRGVLSRHDGTRDAACVRTVDRIEFEVSSVMHWSWKARRPR